MRPSLLCFLLFASMAAASTATADVITLEIGGFLRQSYTVPRTLFVPQFDGALGTLHSVSITVNPEISGTIEGTAMGSPGAFNGWGAGFAGTLRLSGPGFAPTSVSASYADRSGLLTQPNLPVFEFYQPSVRPITVSLNENLANYIGTGTTNLTLAWPTFTPTLFFTQGGRLDRATRDLGAQAGSVTYSFTAVPEPSPSAALLGVGLVAYVASRHGRHSSKPVN